MKLLKKIFLLIVISFFTSSTFAKDPMQFISDVTTSASNILEKNITVEEKKEQLIELAKYAVDIEGIGVYSLGSYKKSVSDEQFNKYQITFREYFLKSFSSRLSQYSNPKINVLSQNLVNDKYTIVSSVLVATDERPEIKIDWRVYTADVDKPIIRDLIIEGLSLARTQKEEFNSVIQSADGNINVLIQNLEDFNSK